ncbi:hypothetical protein KSF78_0005599 [Schistosoma japonicum]|nr:hypothetical protein KSF78_0005599 [Schistosoma japonicum]
MKSTGCPSVDCEWLVEIVSLADSVISVLLLINLLQTKSQGEIERYETDKDDVRFYLVNNRFKTNSNSDYYATSLLIKYYTIPVKY